MKKIVSIILVMAVVFSVAISPASAYETASTENSQRSIYYRNADIYLTQTGSNLIANINIEGISGVTTQIIAKPYLQKYENGSWQTTMYWTESSQSEYLNSSRPVSAEYGKKYRLKVDLTVYSGSQFERATIYSNEILFN